MHWFGHVPWGGRTTYDAVCLTAAQSVWCPIDDCNERNGTLRVMPDFGVRTHPSSDACFEAWAARLVFNECFLRRGMCRFAPVVPLQTE